MAKPRTTTRLENWPGAARGRGAFTLLEILIALAIVVALLALVAQPLARRLGDSRFRETLSQIEAAMMLVRADAQRNGSAIEVFARDGRAGFQLLGREVDFGQGAPPEDESSGQGTAHERLVFELPAGFVIGESELSSAPRKAESEGMAPPPVPVDEESGAGGDADPAGAVVVFLPDGSAARGTGSGVVTDRAGRRAEMKVNTWTGRVEVVPGAPAPAGGRGARGRRPVGRGTRRTWAAFERPRRRYRAAPGALLLETMVALAIFVAGGLAVMAMVNRATASMALARDHRGAADQARSAMAKIEAGIATPQTLNGPVAPWDPGEDTGEESGTEIGSGFSDAPPEASGWELEILTEPSAFEGLTLVSVKAMRRAGEASERVRAAYTLRQLVRLGGGGSETAGDQDPMAEKVGPRPESKPRGDGAGREGGVR